MSYTGGYYLIDHMDVLVTWFSAVSHVDRKAPGLHDCLSA